jgi:hypothetical protein
MVSLYSNVSIDNMLILDRHLELQLMDRLCSVRYDLCSTGQCSCDSDLVRLHWLATLWAWVSVRVSS